MGCDIHGMVEVKEYSNMCGGSAFWEGVINLGYVSRNYFFFCSLAGVRCNIDEIEPEASNRRLPDDIAYNTERLFDDEKDDAHSCTYITPIELVDVVNDTNTKNTKSWRALIDMVGCLVDIYGIDNVRLVIWFDN